MQQIEAYVKKTQWSDYTIELASADASFRRYFRLKKVDKTFVLMDSSLEKESLEPFMDVTSRLLEAGVKAPKILDKNLDDGFLIIEDFGNTHYLNILNESNFKELYIRAIDEIVLMQKADTKNLPLYDREFLHFEMDLMKEWFLKKYLHVDLNSKEDAMIEQTLKSISDEVLSQPQGLFVHRDYHSRNIMITDEGSVGVIDYQDAMSGALTYDLVSLLKDCYIEFDTEDIERLALSFRDKKGLHVSDEEFIKWFDFMGLQRHIKVLGIFCRLYLRDGKDGYLNDLPMTLGYVLKTAPKYEETKELALYLKRISL